MRMFCRYVTKVLKQKVLDLRTYSILILQAFLLYLYAKPIILFSSAVEHPVTPWYFPFELSNLYFAFLFLLSVAYYYADVPFMQYKNMYQVIRTGRRKWVCGQITAMLIEAFGMILFDMMVSILMLTGHIEWSSDWGKVWHTIALTNAGESYGFLFGVPYEILSEYSPIEFMLLTFVMTGLVVFLIGLIMFAVSLWCRMGALMLASCAALMLFVSECVHPALVIKIANVLPSQWIRFALLDTKQYGYPMLPSLQHMILVLAAGIIITISVIIWRIEYVEFQWSREE